MKEEVPVGNISVGDQKRSPMKHRGELFKLQSCEKQVWGTFLASL
jgi:hypothetical protein